MPRYTDDLDRAIVRLLEIDGRLPNLEIARRLGVSEATVRKRIARLMARDGLRVTASIGSAMRRTEMLFLIQTEAGQRLAVAERLAALPCVFHVALTSGTADVVVRAAFTTDAEALDFLVAEVEGSDGVRAVQTLHVLKNLIPAKTDGHTAPQERTGRAALEAFVLEAARAADAGAVLELALEAAHTGFGADRVAVYLLQPGTGRLIHAASRGLSTEYLAAIQTRVGPRTGVGLRVVETRVHLYVEDARSDPLMAGIRDLVLQEGYRTLLFLPMRYGAELTGMLGLYQDTVRRFSDEELALAQALADQLAIALAHVQGQPAQG